MDPKRRFDIDRELQRYELEMRERAIRIIERDYPWIVGEPVFNATADTTEKLGEPEPNEWPTERKRRIALE